MSGSKKGPTSNQRPKPCPICDAPAVAIWRDGGKKAVVVCTVSNCRCKVERCVMEENGVLKMLSKEARNDAIAAWNARDE